MASGSEQPDVFVSLAISVDYIEIISDCAPWILARLFPGSLSTRNPPGARDKAWSPACVSGVRGWPDRAVDREDVPGLTHTQQALLEVFGP